MIRHMAAKNPDKYPQKMGQIWNTDETIALLEKLAIDKPLEEIAKDHERTVGGIKSQQNKLAVLYVTKNNRPIEEVATLLRLTIPQVEEAVKKSKETKPAKLPRPVLPLFYAILCDTVATLM